MKRNEIVEKLMNEGFSEKTLVNFTDKQLTDLSERILSEQVKKGSVVMPKTSTNPMDVKKMTDQGLNVELREKELKGGQKKIDANKNGKIDAEDFKLLKKKKSTDKCPDCGEDKKDCKCDHTHLDEEVSDNKERMTVKVSELKKGDILIGSKLVVVSVSSGAKTPSGKSDVTVKNPKTDKTQTKLWGKHTTVGIFRNTDKKEEVSEVKNWVKNLVETKQFHSFTSKNEIMELIQTKLNNEVISEKILLPDFLTSKSIKKMQNNENSTSPVTKPTTKPDTKPGKPKHNPLNPGPKPNPGPQAESAPTTKPKPTTKPTTKPTKPRHTPFNPGPKPKPGPQAELKKNK
jgi:hypothetical protein